MNMNEVNKTHKNLLTEVIEASYKSFAYEEKIIRIINFITDHIKNEAPNTTRYEKFFEFTSDRESALNKPVIEWPNDDTRDIATNAICSYFRDIGFCALYISNPNEDGRLFISWRNQFELDLLNKIKSSNKIESCENKNEETAQPKKKKKKARKTRIAYENTYKNDFPKFYNDLYTGKTSVKKVAKKLAIAEGTVSKWMERYKKDLENSVK